MTDPIIIASDPNLLDYLAAGATLASAGVIAWQAFQTQRSVKASEEMAVATRDTVKASQDAVEVAQAALRESQLARIESGVPRIFVTTRPYITVDTIFTTLDDPDEPWKSREVQEGEIFKLPRDAKRVLRISHKLTVRNDGPGSVVVRSNVGVSYGRETPVNDVMAPGETREGTFWVRHTVAEWIALWEAQDRREEAVALTVTLSYDGPRDADVSEYHDIKVTGSVLVPVPDAIGDWTAEGPVFDGNMKAKVLPARRRYWRSRSQNLEF